MLHAVWCTTCAALRDSFAAAAAAAAAHGPYRAVGAAQAPPSCPLWFGAPFLGGGLLRPPPPTCAAPPCRRA